MVYTGQTKQQVESIQREFNLRWKMDNKIQFKLSKAKYFTVKICEKNVCCGRNTKRFFNYWAKYRVLHCKTLDQ